MVLKVPKNEEVTMGFCGQLQIRLDRPPIRDMA